MSEIVDYLHHGATKVTPRILKGIHKNLPYLIGEFASNNIGAASATGIFAVILANIVAIFLLRMVGKNLMD